jgi:hypothetical protein
MQVNHDKGSSFEESHFDITFAIVFRTRLLDCAEPAISFAIRFQAKQKL